MKTKDLADLFGASDGGDYGLADLFGGSDGTGGFADGWGTGFGFDPGGGGDFGVPDFSGLDQSTIDTLNSIGYGQDTGDSILGGLGPILNGIGGSLSGGGMSGGSSGSSQGGGLKPGASGGSGFSLASLLPLLASIGGGLYGANQTGHAADQAVAGINAASQDARNTIGAAQANYAPYIAQGQQSLANIANRAPSNIAGMFQPLGSGRAIR